MGLKFEEKECAYALCDEVFPASNSRKIFCSDRCRGRHHAFVNGKEMEMIRLENNMIIANYRILKALPVGRIFLRTELYNMHYKLQYCSRCAIDREASDAVTYWCYDLGLKSMELGFELVSV